MDGQCEGRAKTTAGSALSALWILGPQLRLPALEKVPFLAISAAQEGAVLNLGMR